MVIGGGTEKSQNVPHVDIQAPCPFLESQTVILYICNLVRGLFLAKNFSGKSARRQGFEGVHINNEGNRFLIIPTGRSDIWPHT